MEIRPGDLVLTGGKQFSGIAYVNFAYGSPGDAYLDDDEPVLCLTGVVDWFIDETMSLRMVKVLTKVGIRYVFPVSITDMQVTLGDDEETA